MNDINKIMQLSVSNLAKEQHSALKKHVLDILETVRKVIEQEKYSDITNYITSSPSGDGYGSDNDYIDFGYNPEESLDIAQVCGNLLTLKMQSNK